MYRWVVFLHIGVGVFGFLIAHGVPIAVAFRLRRERDPARILALLELSGSSMPVFYGSFLVLLAAGVLAGFMGDWWGQGWIWTALVLLVAVAVFFGVVAGPYYRRIRTIAGAMAGGSAAVTGEQLEEVLSGPRAWVLAGVGFGALVLILYLMMFKPF